MFIDEISARLVTQGVGVEGVNLFTSSKASIPSGDGPYMTLLETGGSGASLTHNDTATEHPTAQILARASTYPAARAMCAAAYMALGGPNGLFNISLSGVFYLSIKARQNPTDMGLDEETRATVVFNIECEKQPS